MRSMTGFGIGDAPLSSEATSPPSGKLSVEIRAVNHRYLDVRVRAPNQLPDLAAAVETLARERLSRGRFDVTVRVEAAALGAVSIHKEKLKERAERLRLASDVELDPGRLEQEVALYADRVDICEELTRLESHVSHFESLVASPDAVGRRLDFLLQEMAREANTVGAKSQDAGIAHSVVELKAEIERMREQVQNIE